MNVEIITIGDELLIGQVIDTNSAWIARQLGDMGFHTVWKTTVGDVEDDIMEAVSVAFKRADLALVTGGIGPTKDDITKKTLCRIFNTRLIESFEVMENIKEIFNLSNKHMNDLTASQAMVPECAIVLPNKVGTAPGMWFERGEKVLVSLPGVPFEMKRVMKNEVIPRLKKHFLRNLFILHRSLYVTYFSESDLAMRLEDFETALPEFIKLAYLPSAGLIRLRLTGEHKDEQLLSEQIDSFFFDLKELLGENVVIDTDEPIEAVVGRLLRERGYTLGTAESCTGGNIARLITSVAGASDYYAGGVVTYSNAMKEQLLGVLPELLKQFGAVSGEVVTEMLRGTQRHLGSDCAVAVSGIAGPGGGTPEKPVGSVWIGAAVGSWYEVKFYRFGNNREHNIAKSSTLALLMLKKLLEEKR